MRRVLFLFTLAFVVAVPASQRVAACGDKFLQAGRGMQRRHYAPIHSASVLVFAPLRSPGAALFRHPAFQSALGTMGHKLVLVQDEAALNQKLKTERFDLAFVALADVGAFGLPADSGQPAPTVLPVMNKKPTKSEEAVCKLQYACQLKTSDGLNDFLEEMDKAMDVRKKAGKKR